MVIKKEVVQTIMIKPKVKLIVLVQKVKSFKFLSRESVIVQNFTNKFVSCYVLKKFSENIPIQQKRINNDLFSHIQH